ncbi:MAG: serine hydrolase domain-containing protein [Luteibacter sp.]
MKGLTLILVGMVAWCAVAPAQEAPSWRAQADAVVQGIPPDGPGASIVVMQGSRVVYTAARGLASVELGVPISPASRFRIGSLTKTVTAAAVLRLQADHRLDIDQPINTWLPDFPNAAHITVRQLLNHTSGVSDEWDAPLEEHFDTPTRLSFISKAPPDFPPGTDWRYSNSGYMLLGAILEKVTGKPWDEALREGTIAPLGIQHMAFENDWAVVPGLTQGYTLDHAGQLAKPILYSISGPGAAGSLSADAGSVAALLHGLATAPEPWPAIFRAMSTPARIGDVDLPYGLGAVPGKLRGVPVVEHAGGIEGYSAYYVYIPGSDTSVAVLQNSDALKVTARSMARRIAAIAAGRPYLTFTITPWPAKAVEAVAGTYRIDGDSHHRISVHDGKIQIQRSGGPQSTLLTAKDDNLIYGGDGTDYIHVVRDAKGHVTAIEFHADGEAASRHEARIK